MDCGLQEEVLKDPPLNSKRIGQYLFFTDACDTTLEMIDRYYVKASQAVEPFGCMRWMELIRMLRKEYHTLRDDLKEAKEKEVARVGTHEEE